MSSQSENPSTRRPDPRVGRPYPRPVGLGCVLRYFTREGESGGTANTSCDLVIGVDRPTAGQSQAFVAGVAEFVLVDVERIPFVCARVGQTLIEDGRIVQRQLIDWQECPVHPVANRGHVPPIPDDTAHWRLNLVLVDISTRLTAGIRLVSLEPEFCQAFARAMQACRNDFSSIDEYDAKLDDIYRRYPAGSISARGTFLAHGMGID